jgi:hypothetical protein
MIYESHYWKEPLLTSARWLSGLRLSENTRESTYVKLEKELMLGFYSVRKLIETIKISDSTKKIKFDILWYKNTKRVNWLNHAFIDENYDLTKSHSEQRDIEFICNLFVHSYVFVVSGDGKLEGVYVSTDRQKNQKVYFVPLKVILNIFRIVGRDYPSSSTFIRKQNGDLVATVGK